LGGSRPGADVDAAGGAHFVDALDAALEKSGTHGRHNDGRPGGGRRAQLCGIADDVQLLLLGKPQQPSAMEADCFASHRLIPLLGSGRTVA